MIARKSLLIVTSQFLTRFLGWIGLVVLTKLWGSSAPEALGIIGFAMAFVALFTFVGDLGFSSAHVKRISEGKDLGECIGTFLSIKLLLTFLMIAIIGLTLLISETFLNITFYDSTLSVVVLVFIYYYIFSNMSQVPITTFQATREIVKRQICLITENIVKVPLFIAVVIVGAGVVSVSISEQWISLLSLTYVVGIFSSVFIGFWLIRNYPISRPTKKMFKSYFVFAIPVMTLSLVNTFSINIDKIMIGYFWTSIEVGYYFTIQQVLQIILIFSSAIGIVLFPTFSKYHSDRKFIKIKQTIALSMRYISMIMIPILVTIVMLTEPIISIMLNDAFLPASLVLTTLTFLAFFSALGTPFNSLIVGMDKPVIAAKIGIVMCTINIVLNFLFIPKEGLLSSFGISGALGAAFATTISCVIGFLGFCFVIKRLTGVVILHKYFVYHIVAGLVMGTFFYVVRINNPIIVWYTLLIYIGMGLFIYFGVLYLLKEFKDKDLHFFLDLCHPKEMFKYISKEFKK